MHQLLILTGASGAGKTTVADALRRRSLGETHIAHFDSVGVPSPQQMVDEFGSKDEWQRRTLSEWISKLAEDHLPQHQAVLDGQVRLSFIEEACDRAKITDYQILLFDCTDEARAARLLGRGSPELMNPQMLNWASYLRNEAASTSRATVLDTTDMTVEAVADRVARHYL